MKNELHYKFAEKIEQMPESSYGANKIKVILKNGSVFSDVYVAWGKEIVKIGTRLVTADEIPFNVDDIVDVECDM